MRSHYHCRLCILRELFLQKLSAQVRMVLASTDDSIGVVHLAQLAYKSLEISTPSSVATVETPTLAADIKLLRTQVTKLQESIQTLRRRSHPPRHSLGSRSSSPHLASTSPPTPSKVW